jgi:hypothetical protein
MRTRVLAVSALAIFSVNVANADVVFDSLHVAPGSLNADSDGVGVQPLAASFFAPGSPVFSSITLELAATAPTDNGSIRVYIVPDNGAGSGLGKAGSPTYSTVVGGGFTAFTGAQQVGTILDSSLTSSPSAVTVNIAASTPAVNTLDGEYWVGLVYPGSSSANWYFNSDGSGIGTANQANFNSDGGLGPFSLSGGAFEMVVDTPEPASIAILGGGLAGLGFFRCRAAKKN